MRNWSVWPVVILAALRAAASEGDEPRKKLAVDLGGGVKLDMVMIPAGEFTMGDKESRPAHKVKITRPFYLGAYEVTQAQWEAVMGGNPSRFKGAENPVERVSWEDCQEFIKKLNSRRVCINKGYPKSVVSDKEPYVMKDPEDEED